MSSPHTDTHTHRRPRNLDCGISGIQTQSPNGNYQGGERRRGRFQAKNVKRTVHAVFVLSVLEEISGFNKQPNCSHAGGFSHVKQ